MSINIVRVYLPPATGLDHKRIHTGLPLSLRRISSTCPLVSDPLAVTSSTSREQRCARGLSATRDFPNIPAISFGLTPRILVAARFARTIRESTLSYTYAIGASSNRSRKHSSVCGNCIVGWHNFPPIARLPSLTAESLIIEKTWVSLNMSLSLQQ